MYLFPFFFFKFYFNHLFNGVCIYLFFPALLAPRTLQTNHFNLPRPCQKDKQLRVTEGCLTGGGYMYLTSLVKCFWNRATAWSVIIWFRPNNKRKKTCFGGKKNKEKTLKTKEDL